MVVVSLIIGEYLHEEISLHGPINDEFSSRCTYVGPAPHVIALRRTFVIGRRVQGSEGDVSNQVNILAGETSGGTIITGIIDTLRCTVRGTGNFPY